MGRKEKFIDLLLFMKCIFIQVQRLYRKAVWLLCALWNNLDFAKPNSFREQVPRSQGSTAANTSAALVALL